MTKVCLDHFGASYLKLFKYEVWVWGNSKLIKDFKRIYHKINKDFVYLSDNHAQNKSCLWLF